MPTYLQLIVPVDAIPSGSRISVRTRQYNFVANTYKIAITYLKKPIVGTLQTTTKVQQVTTPSNRATQLGHPGGAAWTNSPWATMLASAPADLVLTACTVALNQAGRIFEIDIAIGAAGSEVIIGTVKGNTNSQSGPAYYPFPNPIAGISSGNRIAARVRSTSSIFAYEQRFILHYLELPL
jgi:hypothetical protein